MEGLCLSEEGNTCEKNDVMVSTASRGAGWWTIICTTVGYFANLSSWHADRWLGSDLGQSGHYARRDADLLAEHPCQRRRYSARQQDARSVDDGFRGAAPDHESVDLHPGP